MDLNPISNMSYFQNFLPYKTAYIISKVNETILVNKNKTRFKSYSKQFIL